MWVACCGDQLTDSKAIACRNNIVGCGLFSIWTTVVVSFSMHTVFVQNCCWLLTAVKYCCGDLFSVNSTVGCCCSRGLFSMQPFLVSLLLLVVDCCGGLFPVRPPPPPPNIKHQMYFFSPLFCAPQCGVFIRKFSVHTTSTLSEKSSNFRDLTRNVAENMILLEIFRVVSRFPAIFHVISRKIDFLWDSVGR